MKKIIDEIRQNSLEYGSIPFWSWNDKLEDEELRRQIRDMKELGMKGFFMHARGGLETEYLSDEWFHAVDVCLDEAEKLGMDAWAYDENGWPSGFAGGLLLKDHANHAVSIRQKSGTYPDDFSEIISVYEKNADGTFTRVTENTGKDDYLILYKGYDESYVDTLNGAVIKKFIEATHEEYKKRIPAEKFGTGKVMPGFFTDEPQYNRWDNPYSPILPEEFEKAYGYSIFEKLPAIFYDFDGADKFRYDYYYLIHKLFITNYEKQIYDWCVENGASLTGHAVEETSLGGQMMCAGGLMPFYEYETIPGVDFLGRTVANDLGFKQLGSVCAQLGKKKAMSEMFGCCGWDVSPRELKRIAEVNYVGGVNIMCQHLYPYSERGQRKRDYPLHYSEHNPWHDYMGQFDNYFNNLGATLSRGEEYAPVLVIHPIHGAYCKYKKFTNSLAEIDGKTAEMSEVFACHKIPYHYGDEWMMQRLASVDGASIKVGLCTYKAVVIPFTYSLDSSTVALLKEFYENGGKIYTYASLPEYVDGLPRGDKLDWLKETISFEELCEYRDATVTLNGNVVSQIRKMSRVTDEGRIIFLTNLTGDELCPVKVTLPMGKWAKLDMHTLEVLPVYSYDEDGHTAVELSFADSESHVLIEAECDKEASSPAFETNLIPVPETVKLVNKVENILTLDVAQRSNDGKNYDEPLAVVGIADNLLREKYKGKVYLRFSFDLDYSPADLRVAVEPMYSAISVNGNAITLDPDKYWFDRSFHTADIVPYVKKGKNEIVIEIDYFQRDYVYYVLYGGVSESLRNCLVFDTEVESIYLIGDFGLKCDGKFTEDVRSSVIFDGSFTLVSQPDTVSSSDAVQCGFPFYCGKLTTSFEYDYKAGMATALALDGRFAIAEISVNGHEEYMMFNRVCELKDYLKEGKNEIKVTISNSMRNAMGPHHRGNPEPYSLGPPTFSYENAWKGRECDDFYYRYAFVKFGMVGTATK